MNNNIIQFSEVIMGAPLSPLRRAGAQLAASSLVRSGSAAREMHILMPGYGSRIGKNFIKVLVQKGHSVTAPSRQPQPDSPGIRYEPVGDLSKVTKEKWAQLIHEAHIDLVINMAAASHGSYHTMVPINVDFVATLAEASAEEQVPMINLSSSAALTPGSTPEGTPYAQTKQEAERLLEDFDNVIVLRLNAVLGGPSEVPVCSDAAICRWSPFILIPPTGGEVPFYPVDEETVLKCLSSLVEKIDNIQGKIPENFPQVIDVAGKKVGLETFLKMVNPFALGSVKMPEKLLDMLTKLVDCGVFTKEFTRISQLMAKAGDKAPAPNLQGMEEHLGVQPPNAETVAKAARERLDLLKASKMIAIPIATRVAENVYNLFVQTWFEREDDPLNREERSDVAGGVQSPARAVESRPGAVSVQEGGVVVQPPQSSSAPQEPPKQDGAKPLSGEELILPD